ncbi:hypothetical protein TNCT_531351 [Trichonephila clavata]|uniref:Uncharacterized protein n=1 Tax=Trichonephila clavata TaxID=2740835 RepID=A0A8X6H1V1_TRICU|nr:hypothetical protein TNCT_531351 [Trichonephila clavata]
MDSFYSTSQCGQNKVVVSREFWKCVKEGYIYQINLLQYFPKLIVEPLQDTKNKIFQDQGNFPVPSILPAALLLPSFIPSLVNFADKFTCLNNEENQMREYFEVVNHN